MKRAIIRAVFIIALVSLLGYEFAKELSEMRLLEQENERIKTAIGTLETENEELKRKIDAARNDKSYIEKMAREELGMIKESEKVYKFSE